MSVKDLISDKALHRQIWGLAQTWMKYRYLKTKSDMETPADLEHH